MPGFGSFAFGFGPFGAWPWAKSVLYFLLPELDREFDEDNDFVLEKMMGGFAPQYDLLRNQIRQFPEIRDPLKVRTQYDDVTVLRLGVELIPRGSLEQRGVDATINSFQEFVAPTGRFRFDDIGKELTIVGSATAANNRRVRIARILSPNRVLTDPLLFADATLLTWELRPPVEIDPSLHTFQIQSGYVENILKGWVLFDGAAQYKIVGRRHFNWSDPTRRVFVEQEGADATFNGLGQIVLQSGSFSARDIGKKIVVVGGESPNNEGILEISAIVSGGPPWVIELVQSADLEEAGSPAYWAVRPFSEIDVQALDAPRGVAEQTGVNATVTPPNTITLDGAALDANSVGKLLTLRGSAVGYDGIYSVATVANSFQCTVVATFSAGVESGLVWELRKSTGLGDGTQVQVNAPSILAELAKDANIEIDPREDEKTQRSWVKHVSRWINIKGLDTSYRVVGLLTGLVITVEHLWRVTQEIFVGLAASYPYVIEAGESADGRSGIDGRLFFSSGIVHLRALSALFVSSDVGRHIRVRNASNTSNNKLYTIDQVISATEVAFRPVIDSAITPDFGSGGSLFSPTIRWSVVRLYSTKPPLRPRFDEFNSDLLEEIVDGVPPTQDLFGIDRYCWEPDFVTEVPFNFVSVVAGGENTWVVTVATPGGQPGSAEVILVVGNWVLVDTNGTEYFVETVPVPAGPPNQWVFEVFGTVAPVTGGPDPSYFFYRCEIIPSCDYCGSNKILIGISLGPELISQVGLAVENILTRALERIEQVKPAHVELIIRFTQTLTATLNLSATIEAHPAIYASMIAMVTKVYDILPGDDFITDDTLMATLEIIVTP